MNDETDRVRLLPWTGVHGRTALLLTDGDGPVSRLADRMEAVQLGLGERLLGRARELLTASRPEGEELRLLTDQLADALEDSLLIARSRGMRLGETGRGPAGGTSPALRAYGLLTLPGQDLASARAARHYVRDTCRSWALPRGTTDDLVAITGELVANALEHTGSSTVTITCALTAGAVTVGVTDDGRSGGTPVISASAGACEAEREGGRGLLITDALAARWGTRRTGGGLTVWAEVAVGVVAGVSAGSG
ncbi:ATP-binding protein [Streptomyces sp. AC627_RSS907]|uniref:ATP-binding protein n=1 Tax=Streptomyces sp. AC627_RSS907 TaxID=2823684 RepID=UPI001C240990|nr:ATP-binding protein [Streptomyces sp. AC627_RSS907]